MKVKLQICVFMLLMLASLAESLAVVQRKTVLKGRTLDLHCPLTPQAQSLPVEWRNPDGVKNKRYSLVKLSESEFIVRISDVTFSDGGNYTCAQYLHQAEDRTVEVTVLARPKAEFVIHGDRTAVIKCTAEGNYPPPTVSWQIRNGPEFQTHPEVTKEGKKYVAVEKLHMSTEKATDVKCIVRHPALFSTTLMDFVRIRPNRKNKSLRTTTSFPKTTPALKTTREVTPDQFATEKQTSEYSTTAHYRTAESKDAVSTNVPLSTSQFSSSEGTSVAVPSSTTQNETSRIWGTAGFTTEAATVNISSNGTKKNCTENGFEVERQKEKEENASLLVFLVTCLILGLLVVVIFIFIKLRRAHIAWKRENDDSDTSETSGKSKASQEDNNGQRRRGFINAGTTCYVVQEPAQISSVSNPGVSASPKDSAETEGPPAPPLPPKTACKVKETEL